MTRSSVKQPNSLAYREHGRIRVVPKAKEDVRKAVLSFIDMASTATGQGTFYNTKKEQQDAIEAIHTAVFSVNRGLYAAMLTLPGVTDHSIQRGLERLLDTGCVDETSLLTHDEENRTITYLAKQLPPQRLFKFFGMLKGSKVNNKRTRKLILRSIIGAPQLKFWAVKYRLKLRNALQHAWGVRVTGAIKKSLTGYLYGWPAAGDRAFESKHEGILKKHVDRYMWAAVEKKQAYECLHFILGGPIPFVRQSCAYSVPILQAFLDAKRDLSKGKILPYEVLEGIRGRFHKSTPRSAVMQIAKEQNTISEGQKLAMQESAKKQNVSIDFDPTRQDAVKLYVYCLEKGQMTTEIEEALLEKARRAANAFPLKYAKVGIVLDVSQSMFGTDSAKNRPMAIALAMKDTLCCSAIQGYVVHCGQSDALYTSGHTHIRGCLMPPSGDTSLAEGLVAVMEYDPSVVYIITDGYENAPAGRVDEVIHAIRGLGIEIPIYQITPVMASEKVGVRALSPELAPLPVSKPEGLGLSMIRAAINQDIEQGILSLMSLTTPLLEDSHG